MGVSISEYARHRGVSHVAVLKAIKEGRITPEPDGTIDPQKADAEWEANTRPTVRSKTKNRGKNKAKELDFQISGAPSLLQARAINEAIKAQTNKIKLAKLKGELVDRAKAVAHVFKLARAERDAWLAWPSRVVSQMAAELGVDEHKLFVALDAAVRAHLEELGEIQVRLDDD